MRTRSLSLLLISSGVFVLGVMASTAGAAPTSTSSTTSTTVTSTSGVTTTLLASPTAQGLDVATGIRQAILQGVGCAAVGECVAGGMETTASRGSRAVIATETKGVWGKAVGIGATLQGLSFSSIGAVACPKVARCMAVGAYVHLTSVAARDTFSGFYVTQTSTGWSKVRSIPLRGVGAHPSYDISTLQCPLVNHCIVTGLYFTSAGTTRLFSLTLDNGKWSNPFFFSGARLGTRIHTGAITSLSCPTTSWCMGVGLYSGASGPAESFSVVRVNGKWGALTRRVGPHASTNSNVIMSISCTAPGTCVAGGQSQGGGLDAKGVPLVMTETRGHWQAPYTLTAGSSSTQLLSVSCVSATSCTSIVATSGEALVGAATMNGAGHWTITPISTLSGYSAPLAPQITCVATTCVAVGAGAAGVAGVGAYVPLVVTSTNGIW